MPQVTSRPFLWRLMLVALLACTTRPQATLLVRDRPVGSGDGLVLHDGSLYWASGNEIVFMKTSGGVPAVFAAAQNIPTSLVADDLHLYWANSGTDQGETCGPKACSKPDGSVMRQAFADGTPTTLASGLCAPDSVAVDKRNAYVMEGGSGNVLQIPLSGGSPITLASGQQFARSLAIDETSVYWTSYADVATLSGALRKVPIGGGAIVELASGFRPAANAACGTTDHSLVVLGGRAYWTSDVHDQEDADVLTIATEGGPTSVFAHMQRQERGIGTEALVTDGSALYWSSPNITKAPLNGGTAVNVFSFDDLGNAPGSLAMDAHTLYWTAPYDSRLYSVANP